MPPHRASAMRRSRAPPSGQITIQHLELMPQHPCGGVSGGNRVTASDLRSPGADHPGIPLPASRFYSALRSRAMMSPGARWLAAKPRPEFVICALGQPHPGSGRASLVRSWPIVSSGASPDGVPTKSLPGAKSVQEWRHNRVVILHVEKRRSSGLTPHKQRQRSCSPRNEVGIRTWLRRRINSAMSPTAERRPDASGPIRRPTRCALRSAGDAPPRSRWRLSRVVSSQVVEGGVKTRSVTFLSHCLLPMRSSPRQRISAPRRA